MFPIRIPLWADISAVSKPRILLVEIKHRGWYVTVFRGESIECQLPDRCKYWQEAVVVAKHYRKEKGWWWPLARIKVKMPLVVSK